MYIRLSAAGQVSLEDKDNFRAFKLVIEGGAKRRAAWKALTGMAEFIDDSHAWIFESVLRQHPEVVNNPAWQKSFDTMIEKARPHGWIDEKRKAIKAHIERPA